MKVVCETCEAKYQIPDARVAGRRLKIRCRKCGGVMEARGDELVAHAPAPVAASTEWFASVDGTPIGPLSTDEIVSRISTGVLEWDAHVWREGYAEWKTIDAADTLVRAVASSRSAIADEPRADSTERTSVPRSDEPQPDPYERDARTINEDAPTIATLDDSPTRVSYEETPTRIHTHSAPPGALQPVARAAFASRPPGYLQAVGRSVVGDHSSPNVVASSPNLYASSPTIDVSRAHLTGGALPIPVQTQRAPVSVPPRAGFATAEGSGLIDIRALASLAQSRMNAPQAMRGVSHAQPSQSHDADGDGYAESEPEDNDPLATFGTGHGVAFAALDSLAPASNRERPKDATVPLAILTGAAMIAAAAFAALYITRAPAAAPAPIAAAAQPSTPAVPSVAAPVPSAADEPKPPAEEAAEEVAAPQEPAAVVAPVVPDEPAADKPAVAAVKGPARAKRVGVRKARAEDDEQDPLAAESEPSKPEEKAEKAPPPSIEDIMLADDKPAADKSPAVEVAPAKTKGKAEPDTRSIDDLLEGAVVDKKAAPAAAPALAEAPSRADVLASMRKIEPEVRACAASEATPVTGTANVAITVAGSTGKVMSAEVTGLTGQVGSCIARAARTASFAPFTREKFSVTYPYRFK